MILCSLFFRIEFRCRSMPSLRGNSSSINVRSLPNLTQQLQKADVEHLATSLLCENPALQDMMYARQVEREERLRRLGRTRWGELQSYRSTIALTRADHIRENLSASLRQPSLKLTTTGDEEDGISVAGSLQGNNRGRFETDNWAPVDTSGLWSYSQRKLSGRGPRLAAVGTFPPPRPNGHYSVKNRVHKHCIVTEDRRGKVLTRVFLDGRWMYVP